MPAAMVPPDSVCFACPLRISPAPGPCMQDVADACRTGAATDIIFGLALGYK